MCGKQNKNCLITDIACPCDKRVDIEHKINNKYSQQDLVSSCGMKILLVEDEDEVVEDEDEDEDEVVEDEDDDAPFVLEHWVLF